MEVWISEWNCPSQNDSQTTVWDTKDNALQDTAVAIMLNIENWDLDDPDTKDAAQEINDLVSNCRYSDAIDKYNDHQSQNDFEFQDYFSVGKRNIGTAPQAPALMCFDPPEEDDAEVEPEEIILSVECPCGMFRADCVYHK